MEQDLDMQNFQDAERFKQHLEYACKIVDEWPAWKKEILGVPKREYYPEPIDE